MRGERVGITLGLLGLGATMLTAALALGGVALNSSLLWAMGVVGVVPMLLGALGLVAEWRRARRWEPGADAPPIPRVEPFAAQRMGVDSLALRIRREVHALSDLRARLKSDRLARTVGGPPPEYRAELGQAVQRVSVLLEREREPWAHEFLEEIPARGGLYALVGSEHEADRIHRQAGVYVERLNRFSGLLTAEARDEPASRPVDRVQLLREAYKNGVDLRTRLVWGEGAPRNRDEAQEAARRARDKAREWAEETWEMLLEHFPGHHEREFYGPGNAALGKTGFWLNANEEMKRSSPDTFIEAKLTILSELLDRVDR